ncbi:Sigma-70, region 4 [Streptomyces sp. YIM 130001]|uniref:helix-turn-helix domain-containing protein n=1 Tax=Streptomyces sp. YIM 130001 TaxID=2259644 RepID=UPI000E65B293|nr:helix-turn-helix domain-containing protein [Streptomyces sp. YIM 130001]RII13729.1 Sigma-70, region 4 [Streptomyces sp. YIM 130001]
MDGTQGQEQAGQLDGLMREIRRQAQHSAGPDVQRVLDWLHERTGAQHALVTDARGSVETATAGFPDDVLRPLAPLLTRLSGGQLGAAATRSGALHVSCEALGPYEPRPVLVTVGGSEPTRDARALTSYTGSVLTLLRRAVSGDRSRLGYQHKARQLRFAVLHALLAGEPLLARRMTNGAVPPLLDAARVRVQLLRCPADRDRIARMREDASGYHGRDLLVHCPVFKDHLICLVAEDDEAAGPRGDRADRPGEFLRRLVRDNPGYALGISGAHPLEATAAAYAQAAHALSATRTAADRVVFHDGRSSLADVLPAGPARRWADSLLRPLDSAPKSGIEVTRLAMSMPRSGVARLLGLSRNTVAAHLRRTELSLGRSLTHVRSRAAVQLALTLRAGDGRGAGDGRQPPPSLDDLLSGEPAAAWAGATLRPLEPGHRRTLEAWIDADTDAKETACRLGLSRNTVRAHLRAAESAIGLDLLTHGTAVHDVVHALSITSARTARAQ